MTSAQLIAAGSTEGCSVMETATNYVFEKVGDCIGQHHAEGFGTVDPAEEIQPWDIVVVRPRDGTVFAREMLTDGLDALGKIFLGRTERGVNLATLNPPACIDVPLEEIEALHRAGDLGVEELTPFERGAVLWISQYNTCEPTAPINPEWRPRGCVHLSRLTGEMMTRYASRNWWGAALGPSAEIVETVPRTVGAYLADEWTAGDTRALRKLLPFQNLFYLRRLFDQVEENANRALGVPRRRNVVRE